MVAAATRQFDDAAPRGGSRSPGGSAPSGASAATTVAYSAYIQAAQRSAGSSLLPTNLIPPDQGGTVTLLGQAYGRKTLGGL